MTYRWRSLTSSQRAELLKHRQRLGRPWHRPPHFHEGVRCFHLTAACYQHQSIIGHSPERMSQFAESLLDLLAEPPSAWCLLPNHYHLLVRTSDLKALVAELARLHGRTSFERNREESMRGRKVWHGVADRAMRDTAHFWATLNYIHHNPVRHGYAESWQDWSWSSASSYLEEVGRSQAESIWKSYPVLDYGKGWDDPEM